MHLSEVRAILHRHAGMYVRAYVHGSMARGTEDEHSDVDLVLIYTEKERRELLAESGRYFLRTVFEQGVIVEGTQSRSPARQALRTRYPNGLPGAVLYEVCPPIKRGTHWRSAGR